MKDYINETYLSGLIIVFFFKVNLDSSVLNSFLNFKIFEFELIFEQIWC